MAQILGFRIQNYKVLKNVTLGKLWNLQKNVELTKLTAVIGRNGVGKSTLFDAFGFLSDSLKYGVEEACDKNARGGFEKIRSQGVNEPIMFEIYYRGNQPKESPITYELSIDMDSNGRPYVSRERLRHRRAGQKTGQPFSFLTLKNGKGYCWTGKGISSKSDEELFESTSEIAETEKVELKDKQKLGIELFGSQKKHDKISAFKEFMENWYLSYFTPDAARSLPLAGPQRHLNMHGDNLSNVVQYMEREHGARFNKILEQIAVKIPGINKITTEKSKDGRLLLSFNDKGFKDPFFAQQVSDGTLKLFAYLLLLEDPTPSPFICIEEPENGIYQELLEVLASEFRSHTNVSKNSSQIFVTTHHPNFVDALDPKEVWILEKQNDGFSTIKRASDDETVVNMVENGLSLGSLWYSNHLNVR